MKLECGRTAFHGDTDISSACQFYKAKNSICKKNQQIQLVSYNDKK